MVASQRAPHRAASRSGAHDGPAHSIPNIHEAEWSRCVGPNAVQRRAEQPQCREIVTDATPLLQGKGSFFQITEDVGHIIGNGSHDETIE